MLKPRLIGLVLVRDGLCVQSIGFKRFLPIGRPEIAVEFLNRWGIDEIAVLDLSATARGSACDAETVKRYSRLCQVPLSIGGGIRSVIDVKRIIQAGADKVVINSALAAEPEIVTRAAEHFGSQCVIASIDARRGPAGFSTWTRGGRQASGMAPAEWARRAVELGAGEILISSIDQDGSRAGYDLDLVRSVTQAVSAPVIACGGAGHPRDLAAAIAAGSAAVAVGNMLHYTEHSVIVLKRALEALAQPIRLDSYVTYRHSEVGPEGRLAKLSEEALDALRFRYIPEETI
ncbi:MAG TPA: imidazole glycerol phosphate synthase cyclase subunit [Opitutaceae bacterium]|nr:imidazole glycerol phosphate synthase cyclase subunit [Opitutaceae bacterium]